MSKLRSKIIRLAYERAELRKDLVPLLKESGQADMRVYFPSHGVMELGKLYDQLNSYHRKLKRDKNPDLREHQKLMDDVMDKFISLLAKLKRSEEALYYSARRAADVNWKLEFPSHSVRDKLDKLYDTFSAYSRQVGRDRDPELDNHKKLLSDALSAYVTLLARLKNAERALYRM